MLDGPARWALLFPLGLALGAPLQLNPSRAEKWLGNEGSTTSGLTVEQYLKEAGPDATLIQHGALKIGGKSVTCGKRPTVLTSNFVSWGGAFPGFLILNSKKMQSLSTQVKLYVYNHECGQPVRGGQRDSGRPVRHQARRQVKLARRARPRGDLHLRFAYQG
jgi:hypothetical protein